MGCVCRVRQFACACPCDASQLSILLHHVVPSAVVLALGVVVVVVRLVSRLPLWGSMAAGFRGSWHLLPRIFG
jgi:hypothetical protein